MAAMHNPPRASTSPLWLVVGGTVLAALVAFLVGRFTGDAAPSRTEGRGARSGGAANSEPGWASEPTWQADPGRTATPLGAPPGDPAPAAAAAVAPSSSPAEIPLPGQSSATVTAAFQKAAQETQQQLEVSKRDLIDRCWPSGGLPGGRASTRLIFSVAYDAYGREVGRGVSDDRRAPSGEMAKCVSRLPLGTLRVSPPGTTVSIKVAVNFP